MKLGRLLFAFNILTVISLLIQGGSIQTVKASPLVYLQGTFITIWGDGAVGSQSHPTAYFLSNDQQGNIQLIFDEGLLKTAGGAVTLNHQHVFVQGTWTRAGESFKVLSLSLARGSAASPEGVYGPQPWVSIMCKFSDYPDEPKDWNYFTQMYSPEYPGLDHYWREQSYNLANVEGSAAFGWYVLPQPRSYYVYNNQLDFERAAVDCTGVADEDVYFLDYVGINLMFNADLDCCAWGGAWNLFLEGQWRTYRMTWEPPWGYENIGVIGHETGHGFGLPHSYWNWNAVYDNKWDVMSDVWSNGNRGGVDPVWGTLGQHTVSYHKDMLGWIDPGQMAVIGKGETATITLEQLALPQTGNFLGARILVNDSPVHFLTVEARRRTGYDSWLPPIFYDLPGGVVLHDIHIYDDMPARIIDVDGNGNTGDPASMWEPGETYITPTLGIEMSVITATETGYVVNIRNQYTPLSGVEIVGPSVGAPSASLTFTATVVPENVEPPISFVWQATGQETITNTGGLIDIVHYEWSELGTQAITVTASNEYESVMNHFSIPILMPPSSLEVSGPGKGSVYNTSTFTATVTPITTTVPMTYIWSIDDQVVLTNTTGITDSVTFTWDQPGLHKIAVTASNLVGIVANEATITVFIKLLLPTIYKN